MQSILTTALVCLMTAGVSLASSEGTTAAPQAAAVEIGADQCVAKIPELERAITATPDDGAVHNRLGICYQSIGKLGEARREYQRAIKLNPHHAEAWNNLGTLDHIQGRLQRAVRSYRKAIELKPDSTTTCKNLGVAYLAMGKFDEALSAFREALRIDPSSLDAASGLSMSSLGNPAQQYFLYAKLSAASGNLDAAFEFLGKARAAGYSDFDKVRKDPDFLEVAKDARFASFAKMRS